MFRHELEDLDDRLFDELEQEDLRRTLGGIILTAGSQFQTTQVGRIRDEDLPD